MKLCSLLQGAFGAPETQGKEKKKASISASKKGVRPSVSPTFCLGLWPKLLPCLAHGPASRHKHILGQNLSFSGSGCDPCIGWSVPSMAWLYEGSSDFSFRSVGMGKGETEAGGQLFVNVGI